MFIWENVARDDAKETYVYNTVPGIIIVVLRCLLMLWFLYSLRETYLEETSDTKRKFYFVFAVGFAIWFLTLPFIVSIAAGVAVWVRAKTVFSIYLIQNFLGMGFLTFLFLPKFSKEYFQMTKKDLLFSSGNEGYGAL